MTKSRLPEITLTCSAGHRFTTRAAGGVTVRCKTCRRSKHVPVDRPRTPREAALLAASGREDQDQDHGRELSARWDREPEWAGGTRVAPGRAGDECPECSGPLSWEPGRTLVFCPECRCVDLPAAVTAHYARRTGTEIAVRTGPDRAEQRAVRTRLRALKDQASQYVDSWLDTIADPDCYDMSQWQAQASQLGSLLRGYLPEIANAADEAELGEVRAEINAIIGGDQGRALRTAYDEAANRAERQAQAREQAEIQARQQREIAARQERERIAEARALESARSSERKAVTAKTTKPLPPSGFELAAAQLWAIQQRKEKKLTENGECQFKHFGCVAADRIYGVPFRDRFGQMNGNAIAGTPQYRACVKHYPAAGNRLNQEGYSDVCYWDLPLQIVGSGNGY